MSEKYGVAYNTGNDPLPVDDDGHMLAPQEWAAVQRSKVSEHVAAGGMVWVDPNTITHMSNPIAWEAKQKYGELTEAWELEKAGELPQDDGVVGQIGTPTGYDDSEQITSTSSSTRKRR